MDTIQIVLGQLFTILDACEHVGRHQTLLASSQPDKYSIWSPEDPFLPAGFDLCVILRGDWRRNL